MSPCSIGTFPYTIKPGDTLWLLSQQYNTTVDAIVAANPGVDPNKLLAGQVICIRYGNGISKVEVDLKSDMRMLWEQHVAWTRMTIISIAADLPDLDLVTNRLLRNATDMAAALKPFYGVAAQFPCREMSGFFLPKRAVV